MGDSLAALVLAAGAGTRLAPLTRIRPKPLCPVDGLALVDHAIAKVTEITDRVAVNVHHGRAQMEAHLHQRVHLSIEEPVALGTAGAVGHLRSWLDGSDLLVVNGDTWCPGSLLSAVQGWDRERVRLVVAGPPRFGSRSRVVGSLMPAHQVNRLAPDPSGLYEVCWQPLAATGRLDVVGWDGPFVDCATPRDYLAANMAASGGISVIGDGARVEGTVTRSVLWPNVEVGRNETLVDAIRVSNEMTVLVR